MRYMLAAALAALAVASGLDTAAAASPAAYDWSGAYVGAFAGAAVGSASLSTVVDCSVYDVLCDPSPHYLNNGLLIGATASGSASGSAFTGGGFAGHNWQRGSAVFGFEAAVSALPLDLSNGGSAGTLNLGLYNNNGTVPSVFNVMATASTDWLVTARFRAGFLPSPNLLLYGTAGIAATEFTVSNSFSDNFNNGVGTGNRESSSDAEFGTALVIGAGMEWAMSRRWRLRAEFLHVDFGSLSTAGISTYLPQVPESNPITSTASLTADIVRAGIAYGF
jgi:outer membrane immunogenic protein